MKKVIVVRGVGNSGKTTSIKAVLERLKKNPLSVIKSIKENTDIIVVVEINAIVIVIASAGDLEEILKKIWRQSVSHIHWDVIVCATRSRGKTVEFIEHFARDYSTVWIDKKPSGENQKAANEATALEILSHIDVAL